jgi:hypothetical protein
MLTGTSSNRRSAALRNRRFTVTWRSGEQAFETDPANHPACPLLLVDEPTLAAPTIAWAVAANRDA